MDVETLKRVLWDNVKDLMVEHYKKVNVTRLGADAGIGGSASRIKAQETSVGIDVVAKVAAVFHVAPHQLLMSPRERAAFALFSNKDLREIARIYRETDDEGRRTLLTAARIAKERIKDAGNSGLGKADSAQHR